MIKQIVFGTRGSPLALFQTNSVIEKLKVLHPDISYKRKIIETHGDKYQDFSLTLVEELGLFYSEIQSDLIKNNIDAAVHSLKDIPVEYSKKLYLVAISERVDAEDVLYHPQGLSINNLPPDPVIGTCSLRRRGQIINLRKDVLIKDNNPLKIFAIWDGGLASHGGSGISLGLIEAIRQINDEFRKAQLVHRLDRETSGCIVLALKKSVWGRSGLSEKPLP